MTPDGKGMAGVHIYFAFSVYPGNALTGTDAEGEYDEFIYIPHAETIRVWAEIDGYSFKPGAGTKSWLNGEFAWHHYGNYEIVRLDFIGTSK